MDRDEKNIASGPSTAGEQEPSKSRLIKNRGKTKSPPWRRVVVLDCDQNTVEVRNEFELDPGRSSQPILDNPNSSLAEYQEVKLPSGLSQVTIFLDSQTVTKPTTKEITPDGGSNVKIAKIYLNKLGFSNSVLRHLGRLSTLYVKNIKLWSETSPFASSTHSIDGGETL